MEEGFDVKKYIISSKFKNLYNHNHFEKQKKKEGKIPKHIHQIWIGGKIPKNFSALSKTWQEKHPLWRYTLWTDDKVKNFSFSKCKDAFDKALSIGAKADILRYEILYQYGGVYVDIDFECIKPLDDLVMSHDFFTSIGGFDYVANSLIGSMAFYPLLEKILHFLEFKTAQELKNPWYDTGPFFFTRQVYHYLRKNPGNAVVYPSRFFHPLPNTWRFSYRKGELSKDFIHSFFIPETFAVHYWAESWVGK